MSTLAHAAFRALRIAGIASSAIIAVGLLTADADATMVCTGDVDATGAFCGQDSATVSDVFVGGDFEAPGVGSLEINNGSVLTTTTPRPEGHIATEQGASGTVTITGSGSEWHLTGLFNTGDADDGFGGFLSVGRDGAGTLNVLDGGTLRIDGATGVGPGLILTGGGSGTGSGAVLVGGAGSSIDVSCAVCDTDGEGPFVTIGRGGVGTMTLQDGGALSITGNDAYLAISQGGPPSGVLPHGTLQVLDGSTVAVDGDGGFAQMVVGREPGSDGEVTVAGLSQLTVTGENARIFVGRDGAGELDVTSGSTVLLTGTNSATGDTGVQISTDRNANGVPGVGSVTVDAATLTVNAERAFTNVGREGAGTLTVLNGGVVNILGEGGYGTLNVGRNGNGTLVIDSADQVNVSDTGGNSGVFVAEGAGSVGTVIIDGSGSQLDAGNTLGIGLGFDLVTPGGTGTVSVRNGGVIRGTETHVGDNGFLGGNGTVAGSILNDGGTIAPDLSPGVLTVDGDYTQSDGVLEIEIAGLDPGEFDVLQVTGLASFTGGSILFSFLEDFLPSAGDMIEPA